MKYLHVYSGLDGESHFESLDSPESNKMIFGVTVRSSPAYPAKGLQFMIVGASDQELDYHNAPTSLFCIVLSGYIDVEVSNGEVRRILAGEFALIEDVEGRGHKARYLKGATLAFVRLGE